MTSSRKTAPALFGLDVLMTVAAFCAVNYLRGLYIDWHYVQVVLAGPVPAVVVAIYLIQGYRPRTDMLSLEYASLHIIALIGAMLTTLLFAYVFKYPTATELQSSRFVIGISFIVIAAISLTYRRAAYLRVARSHGERRIVFLGDYAACCGFREECEKMGNTQKVVYSVVTDASVAPFGPRGEGMLLPFHDVLDKVQSQEIAVEAIVLRETNRELLPEVSQRLVQLYFGGVPTYTLELFHQVYWQKIPLYRLNQTWLFQEGFQIAREPVFERLKRASDIFFALVGLVLAAPLIALAAIAIKLDDRGPVFFFQTRIGRNHVPFRLAKLRTMRVSGDEGNRYTQLGDSRITRIGRFLRASRLDELPQLWNVLTGEMSLIGPRAEWDKLVEDYERQISCYHFRHLVKPGITGWAQVNYPYGANMEDTIRKLEYDLYYIRHFSFMLDASIVLKTIHIMVFGKGR
jgi:exopolysaccharide biosynthesis polyprenyl glycosylphosphotransferase